MTTNFTPAQLVDAASDLLARPGAPVTAVYPRAAALLARQALEARVQREWRAAEVSLAETNMANQFHALRQLRNAAIAGTAHETPRHPRVAARQPQEPRRAVGRGARAARHATR